MILLMLKYDTLNTNKMTSEIIVKGKLYKLWEMKDTAREARRFADIHRKLGSKMIVRMQPSGCFWVYAMTSLVPKKRYENAKKHEEHERQIV
jgi:hypothetical protein